MTASHEYAKWVKDNPKKTGKLIKQAIKRFNSDLKRKDIYFDVKEAERVCSFVETILHLWEHPFVGKKVVLYPWQKFIIQNIFGWKWKDSGLRRFRLAYIQVARKNGKTHFADFISLIHLLIDRDVTPQILVGANNEDQAKICTTSMGKIIEASPALKNRVSTKLKEGKDITIYKYKGKVTSILYKNKHRDGVVTAMSKEAGTKDGFNPSLGVIDEFHEAKTEDLLNVIESGQGAREEPLLVVITTAGFNKFLPCYANLRASAVKVLSGINEDDTQFQMVYELDEEDDWKNPDMWIKANPMMPYIKTILPYLKSRFVKAKNEGGTKEVDYITKNLNKWVDAASVWIPDDIIILNNNHGLKESDLIGQDCYVGFDFSKALDLSVAGFLFPNIRENLYAFKALTWIPQDKVESNPDRVDYRAWKEKGNMSFHEGNVLDHDFIASDSLEEMEKYNIRLVSFDVKYAYQGAITTIAKAGYEEICKGVGQGFNLSPAVAEVELLANQKRFEFFENPLVRWNFANVDMLIGDKGDRYPSKKKSIAKIDLVTALLTAERGHLQMEAEDPGQGGMFMI